MAKGQKKLQDTATQRSEQQYQVASTAQNNLVNGTTENKEWQGRVKKRLGTIQSGDYANASDFVSNKGRLAEQKRVRDNNLSLTPTGASGLALQYADPTQIALSQKIADNEYSRDQAAQTEEDVRNYQADTYAQEQQLLGQQIGVNQSVMGAGFSQSNYNSSQAAQIAAQRSSQFAQMVGMALGGVASLMGPIAGGLKSGGAPQGSFGLSSSDGVPAYNYAPGRGGTAGGITPLR